VLAELALPELRLIPARIMAESREQAQRLILAGLIRVGGHPVTKCGNAVSDDAVVECVGRERFVSRGGEKLEGACEAFQLDAIGKKCLDVGASTGGFTDCLLQHGASHVVAVDVGHGQIHSRIAADPRVTVMEGFNARTMTQEDLPYRPELAVTDVSFISLTLILPPMVDVLVADGEIVALIKPQFEAGREFIEKGGVVRDANVHEAVIQKIRTFAEGELHLNFCGLVPSPLKGPAGNIEFLAYWKKH